MSKMRRNLIKIRSCAIFSWLTVSSYFKVDKRLRFRLIDFDGKGKIALFYTANNVLLTPLLFTILLFSFLNFFIPIFSFIKKLRKENNKIVKRRGVSKTLFAV